MIEIRPIERLDATVRVPGSKSLTNRALVLGALAEGVTVLRGALDSVDTRRMAESIALLGAEVDWTGTEVRIAGDGFLESPRAVRLDVGESGTALRMLTAVATLAKAEVVLDGEPGLRKRPMGPLVTALRALGADVRTAEGETAPITVVPGPLLGGPVSVAGGESSQYVSALLLIGPRLPGGLDLAVSGTAVSRPYVDLTLGALRDFGAEVREADGSYSVRPGGLEGIDYAVEADASSAAYFFAAAAVTGGTVRVEGIPRASRQADLAILDLLERMGAAVERGEGWVTVAGGSLRGVDADLRDSPDLSPLLAAVGMVAEGPTVVRGVPHLRVKESDRIASSVAAVRALGGVAEERPDGLFIEGGGGGVDPGTVDPAGDHRIAMAFSVLGLTRPGVVLLDQNCAAKSFPGFFDLLRALDD